MSVVCAALALVMTAGARSPAAPTDGVLRLVWWTDVGFPTPFAFSTVGPGGVVRVSLLYDTLVWKDHTGVIPWLASSWRIAPDGRRVTFTLRPGVRWHDGRPLLAEDVRFTFDYYRRHPFLWVDVGVIDTVEAEGPSTVTFVLREPYAPFLEDIAGIAPIIPAHVWRGIEEPRRAQRREVAVGSGPFRLLDYAPASGDYRLGAHAGYFRGRPRFTEVRYSVVPAERQILAVHSGQADAAMADTYDVVRAYAAHPYLKTWATPPLSVARLIFNLDRPPLHLRAVRRAIAHAVNRAALAALVTRGPGVPGNPGMVPPGDPWHAAGVPAYPYDPSRAKALLREAGVEPISLEVLATASPVLPLLQTMLRDAGIEVTIRTVDAHTRAQLLAEGRFQMALTFHIGAGGDPDYLRRWFDGSEANAFGAGGRFAHPAYQRLAAEQVRLVDRAARMRVIHQMQGILADELPTLPLFYRRFYWLYDGRKLAPVNVPGGLMNGIPLIENKLALLAP